MAANAAETSLNISLFEWLILEEPQLQHSGETNVAQVNTATEKFVIYVDKTREPTRLSLTNYAHTKIIVGKDSKMCNKTYGFWNS